MGELEIRIIIGGGKKRKECLQFFMTTLAIILFGDTFRFVLDKAKNKTKTKP